MTQKFSYLIKPRVLIATAIFALILMELHELVHTIPGALICGGFGVRDFNSWELKTGCSSPIPGALGPIFTFLVVWLAAWHLQSGAKIGRLRALVLLIAVAPIARVLTALLGGGDERVFVQYFMAAGQSSLSTWIAVAITVSLSFWPLLVLYRTLEKRVLVFLACVVLPVVFLIVMVLVVLNGALSTGFLALPIIAGSPLLVIVYTVGLLLLAPVAWRWTRGEAKAKAKAV